MRKSNNPNIRFHAYTEDWKEQRLDEIVEFSKGKGYSKKDLQKSGCPIILYGRLYTDYEFAIDDVDTFAEEKDDSVLSKGNEVIVPASGESAADIARASAVTKPGMLLGGDLNILKPADCIQPEFLALSVSNGSIKKELARRAQGGTIVHLHNSDMEDLSVSYPSYREQTDIVELVHDIDSLLKSQKNKIEKLTQVYKGMLDKLFPEKNTDIPRLRFTEFANEWRRCKLGDLVFRIERKNTENESDLPLTISAQYGLIDQNVYFDKRVASRDVSNYYLVYNGEFAYNKSSSDSSPYGVVKRLDLYEKGVLSTLYIVFGIKDSSAVDSDFLTLFFESDRWHREIAIRASEGARNHGLLNISTTDFFDMDMMIPESLEEQKAIGKLFVSLNQLINLHQQKLEQLQHIKSALLDKMFVS